MLSCHPGLDPGSTKLINNPKILKRVQDDKQTSKLLFLGSYINHRHSQPAPNRTWREIDKILNTAYWP
ncbi:MAG: hypothetical protein US49_C0010G0005 [candidate division TM6 bacterium GW2011_GWF2_37_49]|nr:MAG: hypothetical protein US49_C0010G0005 [candidate division TM6 bacterium GW2011_GWF2_37_49]